jgi:hypothetical protein
VKASINTQLVRIGLVISLDWEHGTSMDHIAPAATTYPMTISGYDTMLPVSLPRGWIQKMKRMLPVLLAHGLFLT